MRRYETQYYSGVTINVINLASAEYCVRRGCYALYINMHPLDVLKLEQELYKQYGNFFNNIDMGSIKVFNMKVLRSECVEKDKWFVSS